MGSARKKPAGERPALKRAVGRHAASSAPLRRAATPPRPRQEPDPLEAADAALVADVDACMAAAARRAGPLFGCGPGRQDCCIGPFPVNLTDVRRLQRGLAELGRRDAARAGAVVRRALRARARLRAGFPGDLETGLLGGDEHAEERFCGEHGDEPCPALDPRSRRCDLYPWRPLVCRTMGPPVRIGDTDLPPCPYCFAPAPPAEIERCRAVPDRRAREDRLLRRLEARCGLRGETLVAFALTGRPRLP